HELTHALEDQYYDLDKRLVEAGRDDDLVFARSAVHEGSATIVMSLVMAKGIQEGWISRKDLEALSESDVGKAEKLAAAPPVLRRELLGTYLLGVSFLLRGNTSALSSGKFPVADVDTAYRAGPVSSEQILHPDKYWDAAHRDAPRRVLIP